LSTKRVSPTTATDRARPIGRDVAAIRAVTPRDGLTAKEREQPFTDRPETRQLEADAAGAVPSQLELFAPAAAGTLIPFPGGLPPLDASSSLEIARAWYRRELELARRPRNTVDSYIYDLGLMQTRIGPKPIDQITRRDIANYLAQSGGRASRKRRLTSARRFFRFLIDDARVLDTDPTDGYYPHTIPLRSPVPLFAEEQETLLAVAAEDEPWSRIAIWLMLRLGLSRSELLALRREHIELENPERPVIYVFYDDPTKRAKERKLAANAEFASLYAEYLATASPIDRLFPVFPATVNVMVDRVRQAAGIQKDVTPKTLRHTYAIDKAKTGADETQLLTLLGLADDPRNRTSVRRYLKLAEPPL